MDRPSKRLRTDVDGGPDPPPPSAAVASLHPVLESTPSTTVVINSDSHVVVTRQLDVDAAALLGSLRKSHHTTPSALDAAAAPPSQHPDTAAPALPNRMVPAQHPQHQQAAHQQNHPLPPTIGLQADAERKAALIHECRSRDSRCSRVIGHAHLAGVHTLFEGSDHVMADVVGDGAKIAQCPKRGVHPHIHSHFYSVADAKRSKRRLVPVFLFWKARLGWKFPITDEIVEMSRAHLGSCEFGFFPGNGHLKTRPKLCIHPGHLCPSNSMNYGPLLMPLIGVLNILKLFADDQNILIEMKDLGWNGQYFNSVKTKNPKEVFDSLLARINKAWANRPPDPALETKSVSPKHGSVTTQGRSPASRRVSANRKPSTGRGRGGGRKSAATAAAAVPASAAVGSGSWNGYSTTAANSNSAAHATTALQMWPVAGQAGLSEALPMREQQQQLIMLQQHQQLVALQEQVFIQQLQLQQVQQAAAVSASSTAVESPMPTAAATNTQLAGASTQQQAMAAAVSAAAASSGAMPRMMPGLGLVQGFMGPMGLDGGAAANAAGVAMRAPPPIAGANTATSAAAMMFQGMFTGMQPQAIHLQGMPPQAMQLHGMPPQAMGMQQHGMQQQHQLQQRQLQQQQLQQQQLQQQQLQQMQQRQLQQQQLQQQQLQQQQIQQQQLHQVAAVSVAAASMSPSKALGLNPPAVAPPSASSVFPPSSLSALATPILTATAMAGQLNSPQPV